MWFRWRKKNGCPAVCPIDNSQCTHQDSSDTIPLDMAENGSVVCIHSINGRGPIPRRLMEIGFLRGTQVKVLRRAPLEDPIEFELRGFLVSLRREEAHLILVVPVNQDRLQTIDSAEKAIG